MSTHAEKTRENKIQSVSSKVSPSEIDTESVFQFADNRADAIAQRKLQALAENYTALRQQPFQKKENTAQLCSTVVQLKNKALILELGRNYKQDRNYHSWEGGPGVEHVGWKAHIGANPDDMIPMARVLAPLLIRNKVPHKFDTSSAERPIPKFLTIYPPEDETQWYKVIGEIEPNLDNFGDVDVESDMQVGKTGRVRMRHGQNTRLTVEMAGSLIEEAGNLDNYKRYKGAEDVGLPLLSIDGTLFFSKTQKAPVKLTPDYIYMATLFNGQVMADKREEPNPLNADMPEGVNAYEVAEGNNDGGGGCCFITTACVQHMGLSDNCEDLTVLRNFRDTYLLSKSNGPELFQLYYDFSPSILQGIKKREDEEEIFARLYKIIKECVEAIKIGDAEFAFNTYCNMVVDLKKEFIPEINTRNHGGQTLQNTYWHSES